ncbi:MAG TPA: ankyrin repeat domain-containing protein, partial [Chloroflexota bacterium]|nr:ankyrin repeat domain-containing protein [Chloroflexota bacterium]
MDRSAEVFSSIQAGDQARLASLVAEDPTLARSTNQAGVSALMMAAYMRQSDLVRVLLESGAEMDVFAAAALGDAARLRVIAAERPDRLAASSSDGWSPLALAAHFNQIETTGVLLDLGANLQARSVNDNGNTALHAALAGQSGETAALLLRRGADVNAADANGWTPLHLAAGSGQLDLVQLVLEYQPFVDPENQEGMTPIALAQSGGHQDIVDLLHPHS